MAQESHFLDAHTHVQLAAFDEDRKEVLARAREAGVWMINVGTQLETSKAAVNLTEELAGHETGVLAAVGLHPVHTAKSFHDEQEFGSDEKLKKVSAHGEKFNLASYRKLAAHPNVVAIGECGLDYYHFADNEPREDQVRKQKEAFMGQIELSHETGKPLMIHCRNAFPDLIQILKNYEKKLGGSLGRNPGVVHFFTGTADDAHMLLNLGFSFTFGGAITFPPRKGKAEGDYDRLVKIIPANRILSETDAPYVSPIAHRGERNEPAYVVEVVKRLAELKNISPEAMKKHIWENARRIFQI
jgi:TatD DNase family protein